MMYSQSFNKCLCVALLCCVLITSCGVPANTTRPNTPSAQVATQTTTQTPSKTITVTDSPAPTFTPTLAQTPSPSPTMQSPTPQATTATPNEITTKASDKVTIPILLYHNIRGDTSTSRYEVSVPDFQSQMNALQEMGYQTISLSQFLDALTNGTTLPENAIIITFDDGHMSVYENAFPIMDALGYSGVLYIVANRINNIPGFMNLAILQEMINAGWEVGSHSYTHADLTYNHWLAYQEIALSKIDLEKALQVEIQTFAYPYGAFDIYLGQKVQQYGYQAGMGLGTSQNHTINTQYYLSRIEIYGDVSLDKFQQIFKDN